jgi:hypothetical protein
VFTHRLVVCIVFLACGLSAQNTIPPGTILPVLLSDTVDSRESKPGQSIVAELAQEVPLGTQVIDRGAKLLGEITEIENTPNRGMLTLRFDRITFGRVQVPVRTQLRAIADSMSISDAQTPTDAAPLRGSSQARSTVQIGGDVVYRGGGPVQSRAGEVVGTPVGCISCGVVVTVPKSPPGPECAGATADDTRPQATWVFSADACGVYGLTGLRFQNESTISKDGQIVFSEDKPVKLPSGTGLLLVVTDIPQGVP